MAELIPSPDEVRCRVAEDLPLVLHALLLQGNPGFDPERFIDAHLNERDRLLIQRLEGLVSADDLQVPFGDGNDTDIAPLAQRVPLVYPMWVMLTSAVSKSALVTVQQALNPPDESG